MSRQIDQEWRDRAACKGIPVEQFFNGRKGGRPPTHDSCDTCPVKEECLNDALYDPYLAEADKGKAGGYRGGMTASGRARLRREMGLSIEYPSLTLP